MLLKKWAPKRRQLHALKHQDDIKSTPLLLLLCKNTQKLLAVAWTSA